MRKIWLKITYFILLPLFLISLAVPMSAQINKTESTTMETGNASPESASAAEAPAITTVENLPAEDPPVFLHEKQENEPGGVQKIRVYDKGFAYCVNYPVIGNLAIDSRIEAEARDIAAGFNETGKSHTAKEPLKMVADYKTFLSTDANESVTGTYSLLSVVFKTYSVFSAEGARENTVRTLLFDLNTARQLTLDDVFGRDYLDVVARKTAAYFSGDPEYAGSATEHFIANTAPAIENYSKFALLPGEAVFYFDRSAILPDSFGCPSFSIPLTGLYNYMKIKATAREPFRMFAPGEKMIALTFDDGPKSPNTDRILDILQNAGGRATFFVVGRMTSGYRETVKRAYLNGCDIGNHSFSHQKMALDMSMDDIQYQISACSDAITDIIGVPPDFFRIPYGFYNMNADALANMPLIGWNVDTVDWSYSDTNKKNRTKEQRDRDMQNIMNRTLDTVQDGDIVLMHDYYAFTADMCETLIPELVARGFRLVTINELFAARGITPENGKRYFKLRP